MEAFWNFMQTAALCGTGLAAVFLVLLNTDGPIAGWTLRVFSALLHAITGLLVLYIVNPVDLLPDVIPILGQVDDAAALVTAFFTGIAGLIGFSASAEKIAPTKQLPS